MATGFLLIIAGKSFKPSLAGLALSYALQMGQLFQFATRLTSETEAIFTAVGVGRPAPRPHVPPPPFPPRPQSTPLHAMPSTPVLHR